MARTAPEMLRTPKLHFDLVRQHVPEVEQFHRMMVREHAHMTDDELAHGTCSSVVTMLEGSPKFMAYQMMMYDRFGQNSFVVGPRVQDLFRRTDLSKITPDLVVEPKTAFYIAVPDCPWQIWGGDRTRWHNVEGIYVAFVDSVDGNDLPPGDLRQVPTSTLEMCRERCIQILLWGGPNERSIVPTDDALLWFALNLDRWVAGGEDIETFFQRHAVMNSEGDPAFDAEGDPLDPFLSPIMPPDAEGIAKQRESLVSVMRLILNLCLYMASDEPNLETSGPETEAAKLRAEIDRKGDEAKRKKSPGKRKKLDAQQQRLREKLARLPRTRVVYVGPMFEEVLEKEHREQARGLGGSHASPIEHGVRPHWQHYWVGSGDDRRRILRHKGMYLRGSGKPDRTIVKIRE